MAGVLAEQQFELNVSILSAIQCLLPMTEPYTVMKNNYIVWLCWPSHDLGQWACLEAIPALARAVVGILLLLTS